MWTFGAGQITFGYPDGRPEMIHPAGDTMRVSIAVEDGVLAEGTAKLHYHAGAGWQEVDLVASEGGLFDANFPPVSCETEYGPKA